MSLSLPLYLSPILAAQNDGDYFAVPETFKPRSENELAFSPFSPSFNLGPLRSELVPTLAMREVTPH
jgi:hypothetical protein